MKPMNEFTKIRKKGRKYIYVQFVILLILLLSVYIEKRYLSIVISNIYEISGWFILILGIVILFFSIFNFAQIITPNPVPREKAVLRTPGIYSLIRHPMYLSIILIATGYVMMNSCLMSFTVVILLLIFFIKKIKLEETILKIRFPSYTKYISKTKKLIPFIY